MRPMMTAAALSALIACGGAGAQNQQSGNLAPGGGSKEQSRPRQQAAGSGAPVETGPKSVPEFQPAFPGQTRAPAVKTRTSLQVTEIASGIPSAASMCFDAGANQLVIPMNPNNAVAIVKLK